jgi:hypothetical protein
MTNERAKDDGAWPQGVNWDLGFGHGHMGEILWRCDALRAGRLYQRNLFATREEAEDFVARMRQVEPDQVFNVEAIKANTVWNLSSRHLITAAPTRAAVCCLCILSGVRR